jgi:hypothetical protein
MELPSIPVTVVSESHARTQLREHPGDGLEAWLADQPWQPAEDGSWRVEPARDGWTYRVEGLISQSVRVVARSPAGAVTAWLAGF